MKPIAKNEIYQHLSSFLKSKGIELADGSYPQGIQKSCEILTDAINLGQEGIGQAKVKLNTNLDKVRQIIHEKTAPKQPAQSTPSPKRPAKTAKSAQTKAASKGAKRPDKTKPRTS